MGAYIVRTGQNIFDVAMSTHGTAEGIMDLLFCNPDLSLDRRLQPGDRLLYTDQRILDPLVVQYFKNHGVVPANGERNVYYREKPSQERLVFFVSPEHYSPEFKVAGNGELYVDWGDNSGLQMVRLSQYEQRIFHTIDYNQEDERKISFMGSFDLTRLDATGLRPQHIFTISPVYLERFVLQNSKIHDIGFVALFTALSELDLSGSSVNDLSPLVETEQLRRLDLSECRMDASVAERYLIDLVEDYRSRRSCQVVLKGHCVSGTFQEPTDLKAPQSGQEAMWVLMHAREEEGKWEFVF